MLLKKSTLYLRIYEGTVETLFFPLEDQTEEKPGINTQILIRVRSGKAYAQFNKAYESTLHGQLSAAGAKIEFKKANIFDLAYLFHNWNQTEKMNVTGWVKEIFERPECYKPLHWLTHMMIYTASRTFRKKGK